MRSLLVTVTAVAAALALPAAAQAQAMTGKCTYLPESADDFKQTDNEWPDDAASIPFRVIRSSMPDRNLVTERPYNKNRMLRRIVDGALAWTLGRDSCGYDQWMRIPFAYSGDEGSSALNWEDNINTVDFRNPVNGSLLGGHCPEPESGILIGCEHTRSKDGEVKETDIGFSRTADWWIGARPPRRVAYDLRSSATHEFGHSLEIKHPSDRAGEDHPGARKQVMWSRLREGRSNRYLGSYDFGGMCATIGCRNPPD
jgi:hypothetical protein